MLKFICGLTELDWFDRNWFDTSLDCSVLSRWFKLMWSCCHSNKTLNSTRAASSQSRESESSSQRSQRSGLSGHEFVCQSSRALSWTGLLARLYWYIDVWIWPHVVTVWLAFSRDVVEDKLTSTAIFFLKQSLSNVQGDLNGQKVIQSDICVRYLKMNWFNFLHWSNKLCKPQPRVFPQNEISLCFVCFSCVRLSLQSFNPLKRQVAVL